MTKTGRMTFDEVRKREAAFHRKRRLRELREKATSRSREELRKNLAEAHVALNAYAEATKADPSDLIDYKEYKKLVNKIVYLLGALDARVKLDKMKREGDKP